MGSTGNMGRKGLSRRERALEYLVVVVALYIVVALFTFQWRHPKLGEAQFYRHLPQALLFQVVDLPDTGARDGGR